MSVADDEIFPGWGEDWGCDEDTVSDVKCVLSAAVFCDASTGSSDTKRLREDDGEEEGATESVKKRPRLA